MGVVSPENIVVNSSPAPRNDATADMIHKACDTPFLVIRGLLPERPDYDCPDPNDDGRASQEGATR